MSFSTNPKDGQKQGVGNSMSNGGAINNTKLYSVKNTEQPQTKRQKIEKLNPTNGITKIKSTATLSLPLDKIDTEQFKNISSSLSSSVHFKASSSSDDSSLSSTSSLSRPASLKEVINVQHSNHILPIINNYYHHHPQEEKSHLYSSVTRSYNCSSNNTIDEMDQSCLQDLLQLNRQYDIKTANITSKKSSNSPAMNSITSFSHSPDLNVLTSSQDMRQFEYFLNEQCLCGVSEQMLTKSFLSHYSLGANGQKRVAKLSEWPSNKLLQFLSNIQLLFDIYLKQNSKGSICARIMDVCDALIRNDYNLIDEIIVLGAYSNAYVQFLAERVLASFLVLCKQGMDNNWLKKLVDNLYNFDRLDHKTLQRIHFSLEIIKRILDWRDIDLHPLEEEIADSQNIKDDMSTTPSNFMHFRTQQPSLESNYFAVYYDSTESLDESSSSGLSTGHHKCNASSNPHLTNLVSAACHEHNFTPHDSAQHHHLIVQTQQQDCHLIILTDPQSIDTTHHKSNTITILENKWPALVEKMIALMKNHLDVENAENCILNFLQLWEKIISVKTNLPIGETQPFYAHLDIELLLNQNLSCTVYKQLLCLFNEALCYGSTLALQDILPNEICQLAQQIVMHIQASPILGTIPREQPENLVGFIGFKGKPIDYAFDSLRHQLFDPLTDDSENSLDLSDVIKMDRTILQKFFLLVLKSIAVKVKVIRIDSSDSSINSADYEAFRDRELIASISDVVHKLEFFTKDALELLPQCHFSEILIRLFDDQDDYLIEAMMCSLDAAARISFLNNVLPKMQSQHLNSLLSTLNPVYTFLEFLNSIRYRYDLLLDLLVSNETCFLLYLLRFLKYICKDWLMFVDSCHDFAVVARVQQQQQQQSTLDDAMGVLISLRLQISRLVARQLYPYDISPVTSLLLSCERFYEGESV